MRGARIVLAAPHLGEEQTWPARALRVFTTFMSLCQNGATTEAMSEQDFWIVLMC
jgi:hypothetical protein